MMPSKAISCRTFVLSTWWNKNTSPDATEKIDLDGWKQVMRSGLQEDAHKGALETEEDNKRSLETKEDSKRALETEEDSHVAATRELIEMWRLLGKNVPENISEEQLKNLMECPTNSSKKKYLHFLAVKECVKKAEKIKQEKKREAKKERMENAKENGDYELPNTFLMKFWTKSEDNVYNWRAAQSMIFGQPLVFDMDYDACMTYTELKNAVKQLQESEGVNRRATDPFHLHYCSLKEDSPFHKELIKHYGEAWDKLFVTVTEKSHVEIFPRDQLVYLTADSPNVMKTFDHNKIYIIGSLVDKSIQKGVSLGRAKRLGLATARLPLDLYLQWELGSKNLTLNQMLCILLTIKDTGNWAEALQFVPKRKHAGFVDTMSHEINTRRKAKMYERLAGQEQSCRPFAGNSLRWEKQKKWWEDVS
ncbi:hypothetical protein EYD10_03398 [Varanus komodoensis]|nr:hypothetical protein EYD10_03398 [Varanus komodoensis]